MKMFIIKYDFYGGKGEADSYLSYSKTEEEARKKFWSWVNPEDKRAGLYITGVEYVSGE